MQQAGLQGTGAGNARSWLAWGNSCPAKPVYGMIAVFWRNNPHGWQGHVGFFVGQDPHHVYVLGGNQGIGQVSIRPYAKTRLLGFRWPSGVPMPEVA